MFLADIAVAQLVKDSFDVLALCFALISVVLWLKVRFCQGLHNFLEHLLVFEKDLEKGVSLKTGKH